MINFVHSRLKDEFSKLHPQLIKILFWLDGFLNYHWRQSLIITHLMRTQTEQEEIYGKGTSKKSVHQFGRGADISVKDLFANRIAPEILVDAINDAFPYAKPDYKTALYHELDHRGRHIHIQVAE